jgi:hypothetical protein
VLEPSQQLHLMLEFLVCRVPKPDVVLICNHMLIAKLAGLSGFAYDFFDVANKKIGSLRFPDVALATNARLKDHVPAFLSQTIEIVCNDQTFQVEFG